MKILIADDHRLVIEAVKAKLSELQNDIEFVLAMSVDELFASAADDIDLALIDLKKPWFYPQSNIVSHLVYSMAGGVDTTIVNGRVLMQNGIIPGEEEILEKAQQRFIRLTSED